MAEKQVSAVEIEVLKAVIHIDTVKKLLTTEQEFASKTLESLRGVYRESKDEDLAFVGKLYKAVFDEIDKIVIGMGHVSDEITEVYGNLVGEIEKTPFEQRIDEIYNEGVALAKERKESEAQYL